MPAILSCLRLSPAERRIAATAARLLARVAWSLRRRGWAETYRALGAGVRPDRPARVNPVRVVALVHRTADALPFHASCLVRSAVAWRILRGQGVDATLRWAVGRDGEQLKGHAWVCLPGSLRPTDEWTGDDIALMFDSGTDQQ